MSDDSIESLMMEYRRSLPDKAAAIRAAADTTQQAGWRGDTLAALALLVHKLAGSAGAYGYDDIHQQASTLDRKLKTLVEAASQAVPGKTEQSRLRKEVDALIDCLMGNA